MLKPKKAFKKKKKSREVCGDWRRRMEEFRWKGHGNWQVKMENTCGVMEIVRKLLGNFLVQKLILDSYLFTIMPQVKS